MNLDTRSRALALLSAAAFAVNAGGAPVANASADPLGCDSVVHDHDGLLDRARLDPVIESVAGELGADVRVRVEGSLDGGLERRVDQLVEQCPGWQDTDTDELADDMVVLMFSAAERENWIAYGADLGPELEGRWDAATDAMIPDLRREAYTDAVIAGLRGLTVDPVGSSGSSSDEPSDDGSGIPGGLVFVLVMIGIIVVVSIVAKQQGWSSGGGGWGDDGGESTSWFGGGSTRRRRSRSFSFGSPRSPSCSSSGGSRRSGGGSRRAGGGGKKW